MIEKPIIPVAVGAFALILQAPSVVSPSPSPSDLGHWVTILNQSALACGVIYLGWALSQSRKEASADRKSNEERWLARDATHEDLLVKVTEAMTRVCDAVYRCREGR